MLSTLQQLMRSVELDLGVRVGGPAFGQSLEMFLPTSYSLLRIIRIYSKEASETQGELANFHTYEIFVFNGNYQ